MAPRACPVCARRRALVGYEVQVRGHDYTTWRFVRVCSECWEVFFAMLEVGVEASMVSMPLPDVQGNAEHIDQKDEVSGVPIHGSIPTESPLGFV